MTAAEPRTDDPVTAVRERGRDAVVCLVTLLVVLGTVAPAVGAGTVAAAAETGGASVVAYGATGVGTAAVDDGIRVEATNESGVDEPAPNATTAEPDDDPAVPDGGVGVPPDGVYTTATGLQVGISQVESGDFPRIRVYTTVANGSGAPVDGLTRSDFSLTEDGRSEEIAEVTQVGGSEVSDISTALLIDRSGSMDFGDLDAAQAAATEFVGRFRAGDEAQVISFGTDVRTDQRWTQDRTALNNSINSLSAGGGTPLYEAVIDGANAASNREGRSAVVVLTDGEANGDATLSEAIAAANDNGVPVYTIGIGGADETALRELATQTNGQYYAASSTQLSEVYRGISQRFGSEYRLTYRTDNTSTDGTRRQLQVEASNGSASGTGSGSYRAPCAPLPTARIDYTRDGRTVQYDASRSDAGGGSLVAYRWDFNNDGQIDATGRQVSYTYPSTGDYEVRLQVEKRCGATDAVTEPVTVSKGLGIDVSPSEPTANSTVVVSATNLDTVNVSEQEFGPSFTWEFGDGTTASGTQAGHTYDAAGRYRVNLTVLTDSGSANASTTIVVDSDAGGGLKVGDVGVSPEVTFPEGLGVNKTFGVDPDAPNGVDRVEFEIGGDTYVDDSAAGGWTADIPVATSYQPDDELEVTVYGSDGATATTTAGTGVADVGPILETILNLATPKSTRNKFTVSRTIPPGGAKRVEVSLGPVGEVEAELDSSVGASLYRRSTSLEMFGTMAGLAQVPPVQAAGEGRVEGSVDNVPDGWRVESVRGKFDIEVTGGKSISFKILGVGFSAELRLGPFIRGSPIVWGDPAQFPTPTKATVEGGTAVTGTVTGDAAVASLEGTARGEGGARTDYPDLADNVELFGKIVVDGTVRFLFDQVSETWTLWQGDVGVTGAAAPGGAGGDLEPRSKRGSVPRLGTVGTQSPDGVTQTRLTVDGLADESPSLAATGNGTLLAWDRQAADRAVVEGRDLFVKTRAGGSWSNRTRLTNDTVMDFDPSVATPPGAATGGEALVAWTRLNRSFDNISNATPSATFPATDIAVATRSGGTWSAPTVVENGSAATFGAQAAAGDGQYLLAWRYDLDGNRTTLDDRGVAYATYDPATGLDGVTFAGGARAPAVAGDASGLQLAYFVPDAVGDANGTVVVRNVTAGTQRSVPVESFGSLDVSPTAAAWVSGGGANTTLAYAPEGGNVTTSPVRTAQPTGSLSLHDDAGDATAAVTFRGRGLDENGTAGVYARYRGNDRWTNARPLVEDRGSVAFTQPTAASTDSALVAVAMGRNISDSSEYHDLLAAERAYAPELNVSAVADPTSADQNGTPVVYGVANQGGAAADNLTVTVTAGNQTVTGSYGSLGVAGGVLDGVDVDSSVEEATITATGSYAGGTVSDSTNVTVARPDLAVVSVDRRVTGGTVTYTPLVVNLGTGDVSDATVSLTSGNRTVATTSVGSLAASEATTATVAAPTRAVPGGTVTRVEVDAVGRTDLNASNNAIQVDPPLPDLFVPGEGIRAVSSGGCGEANTTGADEFVCALVGNRGPVPVNATVTVATGNETANRSVSLSAGTAGSPTFTTVAVAVDSLNVSDGEQVTVSASGETFDATPSDNTGTTSVQTAAITVPFTGSIPGGAGGDPPIDTDGDGKYEDTNGDGTFNFVDVINFVFAIQSVDYSTLPADQVAAVDFDGNGRVNFVDVIELVFEL